MDRNAQVHAGLAGHDLNPVIDNMPPADPHGIRSPQPRIKQDFHGQSLRRPLVPVGTEGGNVSLAPRAIADRLFADAHCLLNWIASDEADRSRELKQLMQTFAEMNCRSRRHAGKNTIDVLRPHPGQRQVTVVIPEPLQRIPVRRLCNRCQ
ncbi:hypothetical protein [Stappia sp. MMSF_3263]|uniref:hypothetical protein n=1 Tax=Stappia sp. MMSF_3263 TaxID=3046693 RepID=UPI00273FC602|nr:hypothetical protein [Stappia sp. MMSF_3263]